MSWLEVASQIRYPKCAACFPRTVMQWAVSSGQAWALCLPCCCPGVSLGRFCPFSIPIPLCNSGDCGPTSPCMDSQTKEGYRGEGEMSKLVVAWPGRTYGFYYWHEVQHNRQHHCYHTRLIFVKA